jgi:dTMP kinase
MRAEEENPRFRMAAQRRDEGALGPLAYSVWHCADFAERLESLVWPSLRRGEIVLMDRYKYTAFVRDVIRGVDEQVVRSLYSFAPEPDITVYLDVDPAIAYARKKRENAPISHYERGLDLFADLDEQSGFIAFQSLCRKRYPAVLPSTTIHIDGASAPDRVAANVAGIVESNLSAR